MHSKFPSILLFQSASDEWANFIGHFHPLLVHLPIGILVIGIILEYVNRKRQSESLNAALNIVFFWGAFSAILSCIAGYFLKQSGGYDEDTLNWHQNLGIGVAAISLTIYVFKKLIYFGWLRFLDKLIMPFSVLLIIVLILAGHLGANMTHGSDYIQASLPQPFRGWIGIESKSKSIKEHKITDPAKALAYADIINPLLESKCTQCHNADKKKGGLRMDTKEFLIKGGEDGPVFLAGNAASSEMIKRALLPESDDDHMPPKGKPQLTEEEIALLHWWIQNGASFDKKVNDLPQDEKVKPVLATLMAGTSLAGMVGKAAPESPVYSLKVDPANEKSINQLKEKNVLVLPLAKDVNLLEVSCINAKEFNDENAKLLSNISEQLVWLKLSNTKITDASMVTIGKLPNLVKLFLNHTSLTDNGLDNLSNLKNLEYLNLFDTKITDAGLAKIGKIKSLKKLYLWQTKVTKPALEAFKKAHPTMEVDMGWEGKALVSDTTKVTAANTKKDENEN
ncbi:MAG: c-type cytochrome domain-containing protein [Bacteroidota bacterium]